MQLSWDFKWVTVADQGSLTPLPKKKVPNLTGHQEQAMAIILVSNFAFLLLPTVYPLTVDPPHPGSNVSNSLNRVSFECDNGGGKLSKWVSFGQIRQLCQAHSAHYHTSPLDILGKTSWKSALTTSCHSDTLSDRPPHQCSRTDLKKSGGGM